MHKDTLNIHSSILSRLRIHKHTFTTEASFSLAYTITLTSSPLSHISLRRYIHRHVKCIDTRKQRLKINFYVGFLILRGCSPFITWNMYEPIEQQYNNKKNRNTWSYCIQIICTFCFVFALQVQEGKPHQNCQISTCPCQKNQESLALCE